MLTFILLVLFLLLICYVVDRAFGPMVAFVVGVIGIIALITGFPLT